MSIKLDLSPAQITARDTVRALRIPPEKLVTPSKWGRDSAFPTPPLGSTLNPLFPNAGEQRIVIPNAPPNLDPKILEAARTAPRNFRTAFLGQLGIPGWNMADHAKLGHYLNTTENQLNGDILLDSWEIPAWNYDLLNIMDAQTNPNKSVQMQRDLTENGMERAVALSNHLAGKLLVVPTWYLTGRQDVFKTIIASPYLQKALPTGKAVLDEADVEALKKAAFEEMKATIDAAASADIPSVNFFIGSNVWDLFYSFPNPNDVDPAYMRKKNEEAAKILIPLIQYAAARGVTLNLEVHPGEQAYSKSTTIGLIRALLAEDEEATRLAFRINLDISHFVNQDMDAVDFIAALQPNSDYGLGPALDRSLKDPDILIPVSWIGHHHHKGAIFSSDKRGASVLGDHKNFADASLRRDFSSGDFTPDEMPGSPNFHPVYDALARSGFNGRTVAKDGHYRADSAEWEHGGNDPRTKSIHTLRYMAWLQEKHLGGPVGFDNWKKDK